MLPFWLILSAVYALDVATKFLIRARMPVGTEISLLPFFSLTHLNNTGIAFGMFQEKNLLFIVVGTIVITGILVFGIRTVKEDRFSGLVLAMVAGGALGNLTDRIVHGRVTDFLDFYFRAYHWPAFNVADSAICVGAGLLLLKSLQRKS